jgi:hypothetical protein
MYFSKILINVCKCFALFIRQMLPITTNTTETFIHKFIGKGNSQQSNNLKIYKKEFSHIYIHTKCH